MRANVHCIALVGTDVVARISRQHSLCHIQRLVITQHSACKAAALHLCELVNQHIARGYYLALKAQAAAEQKCLAESAAIGEFGEVQLNAFNASQ